MLGARAGLRDPLTVHNYYVPAGGDEPDPEINPKFAHKLRLPRRDARALRHAAQAGERSILVGDLNVAPLECDVWSHKQMLKVVSHTPIECEKLTAAQKAGNWIDVARTFVREPEKLFTWWSYLARWTGKPPTRAAASITSGLAGARRPARGHQGDEGRARLGAAVRPRAGNGDARRVIYCGGVDSIERAHVATMSVSGLGRGARRSGRAVACAASG